MPHAVYASASGAVWSGHWITQTSVEPFDVGSRAQTSTSASSKSGIASMALTERRRVSAGPVGAGVMVGLGVLVGAGVRVNPTVAVGAASVPKKASSNLGEHPTRTRATLRHTRRL